MTGEGIYVHARRTFNIWVSHAFLSWWSYGGYGVYGDHGDYIIHTWLLQVKRDINTGKVGRAKPNRR